MKSTTMLRLNSPSVLIALIGITIFPAHSLVGSNTGGFRAVQAAEASERSNDAPMEKAVDTLVDPIIGKDTPGLGVLVLKNGNILVMKGYGFKGIESGEPVDEKTIFDLASVSKEMTAMAAMMLIAENKLAEDQNVADILPEFNDSPKRYRPITVGDLIHHTSGLADYLNDDDADFNEESTNSDVISWLGTRPLQWSPGTKFDYSNSGYITLASCVTAADHAKSLRDVLQARIWGPLGMKSTGLVVLADGADPADRATGYKGTGGQFVESSEPSVVEGDGNVLTSLEDLALYEKALASHRLLTKEQTNTLFENAIFDNGSQLMDASGQGYGFGWFLTEEDGVHYASHSGSWMGTSTYYQRNLDTGVTVILLANGEDISLDELAGSIDEAVSDTK